MNRRDFLQLLATLSAGSALPIAFPRFAYAQSLGTFDAATARFFVLLRIPPSNGWDVTLCTDPKIHANGSTQDDMFIEYTADKILDASGVKLGPAAAPLMKHKGEFSVVNGLIMAANNQDHDSNAEYMASGNGEGKAPYLPVELAASMPSGSLGVVFEGSTKAKDRKIMISSLASVQALVTMLDLSEFGGYIGGATESAEFKRAQDALINDGPRLHDLISRIKGKTSNSSTDQASIVAATFASGTSLHAQIDIRPKNGLDTHSNHEKNHMDSLTNVFEQISAIFDVFKTTPAGTSGKSLFDRTVFMVASEFGRTPALNAAKGKDHNPLVNSTILAGGGIVGGQQIGESHLIRAEKSLTGMPVHAALPIDFNTLQVARTKKDAQAGAYTYITPEHIIATVATALKADWSVFKSIPQSTPAFTSLIKSGF